MTSPFWRGFSALGGFSENDVTLSENPEWRRHGAGQVAPGRGRGAAAAACGPRTSRGGSPDRVRRSLPAGRGCRRRHCGCTLFRPMHLRGAWGCGAPRRPVGARARARGGRACGYALDGWWRAHSAGRAGAWRHLGRPCGRPAQTRRGLLGRGAPQQPVVVWACARDGRLRRSALGDWMRVHLAGRTGPRRHLARGG